MKIQIIAPALFLAILCSCTPGAGGNTQQTAAYQPSPNASTETIYIEYCDS